VPQLGHTPSAGELGALTLPPADRTEAGVRSQGDPEKDDRDGCQGRPDDDRKHRHELDSSSTET
jgi:hypothetical protein